jgi:hypothetical protein
MVTLSNVVAIQFSTLAVAGDRGALLKPWPALSTLRLRQ